MTLSMDAQDALAEFTVPQLGWEQRVRLLMQWGNRLEPKPEWLSDQFLVAGCESTVWLRRHDNQLEAYSDARLVRGMLSLLLVRVQGLSDTELATLDLNDWYKQLGLDRQLSPSRSNGLQAVLRRIRQLNF